MNIYKLLNKLESNCRRVQGQKVFLDRDVAAMFDVSIGRLRQSVNRHAARFPDSAIVKLSDQESAFTLEGVLLLSSILKTPQAVQLNIEIIRELFAYKSS